MRRNVTLLLALAGCGSEAAPNENDGAAPTGAGYGVAFTASFSSDEPFAEATITVTQSDNLVRSLDFNAPASAYQLISGDGSVEVAGDRILWQPPALGGSLRYRYRIDARRGDAWDARHTDTWVVMRLGDLFPVPGNRQDPVPLTRRNLSQS